MAKAKRSAYKTSKGNKRYLKRDKKTGRITDNQSYKRAHAADLRKQHTANDAPPATPESVEGSGF